MKFLMIVECPDIARFVSQNGVDRLFVDLEIMGKLERQGHLCTVRSSQTVELVDVIRQAAPDAHLLVRINPLHEGSKSEIDDVISRGADSVMLPMFRSSEEVDKFLEMLAGRAIAVPLVETALALAAVPDMIARLGLSELHIGLNDLHLDLGLDFMFEPFASGILEASCQKMREAGTMFGIGGIARAGEGILRPEQLLGEHVRLGSRQVILSRTFHRKAKTLDDIKSNMNFADEIKKLRAIYDAFLKMSVEDLEKNKRLTREKIEDVAHRIRSASKDKETKD